MTDARLDTVRRQLAECARERPVLVGYLAGLRLNGEWRDADVQSLIRDLPEAQQMVSDAKTWINELQGNTT